MYERDPACFSPLEPVLFFKGFLALSTYRVAHQLWLDGRRWLALYLQSIASESFAVDIHPAAQIGCGILLDHATSFVVGETAIIEDDVSILHEVTLGAPASCSGPARKSSVASKSAPGPRLAPAASSSPMSPRTPPSPACQPWSSAKCARTIPRSK
jgi:serine acetyltransferase